MAKGVKQPNVAGKSYVVSLENRKARGSGHERHEEILVAARDLFIEFGVENVTTRQIAARVGISQTGLYVYFRNKEELLDRLIGTAFSKLGAALAEADQRFSDPADYLRAAISAYIRFGLAHPNEYRLAFMTRDRGHNGTLGNQKDAPAGIQVFGAMQRRIDQGIKAGVLRNPGARPTQDVQSGLGAAQSLWAAVHGLVALQLAYPSFGWVAPEELIGRHTEMILSGMICNDPVEVRPAPAPRSPRRRNPPA